MRVVEALLLLLPSTMTSSSAVASMSMRGVERPVRQAEELAEV
jgi:hypothetical protein